MHPDKGVPSEDFFSFFVKPIVVFAHKLPKQREVVVDNPIGLPLRPRGRIGETEKPFAHVVAVFPFKAGAESGRQRKGRNAVNAVALLIIENEIEAPFVVCHAAERQVLIKP